MGCKTLVSWAKDTCRPLNKGLRMLDGSVASNIIGWSNEKGSAWRKKWGGKCPLL